MSEGWIKLHRSIVDHPFFKDGNWLKVWIYLLTTASYQPRKVKFKGRIVELVPGQLVTSMTEIAEATQVSKTTVHRVIEAMKSETQIGTEISHLNSLYTIANWERYQSLGTEVGTWTERGRNVDGTTTLIPTNNDGPSAIPKKGRREEGKNQNLSTKENEAPTREQVGEQAPLPLLVEQPPLEDQPAKPPRARNLLLDALVAATGANPLQTTGPAWSRAGKALADIKAVCPDVTPEEIVRRASNYQIKFPGMAVTTSAIAKWWGDCQDAPRQKEHTVF